MGFEMTTPVLITGMSIAEFIERYEQAPFELLEGEIVPMSPTKFRHTEIGKKIYDLILMFPQSVTVGRVFFETTFILPTAQRRDWVTGSRIPDVMFITLARLQAYKTHYPAWQEAPMALVPDWVVEIISPTDSYSEITAKVQRYLQDEVRLLWVVDAAANKIIVYTALNTPPTIYTTTQVITGDPVWSAFSASVLDIFTLE
jgi:Uma2 family endonuclease